MNELLDTVGRVSGNTTRLTVGREHGSGLNGGQERATGDCLAQVLEVLIQALERAALIETLNSDSARTFDAAL